MAVWQLVLYATAAYLAMQSLVRLMEAHRQSRLAELVAQLRQQQIDAEQAELSDSAANPGDAADVDENRAA